MRRSLFLVALPLAFANCSPSPTQAPIPGDLAMDEGAVCFQGVEHPLEAFTLGDITAAVTSAHLVDASIVSTMGGAEAERIIGGLAYLGMAEGNATMADLVAQTDDGEIDVLEFEIGDADVTGYWLRFYAEDMEFGALFVGDNSKPVAIIDDGGVEGCLAIPEELFECSPGQSSVFHGFAADASALAAQSAGSRTVSGDDIPDLSVREIQLLFAASKELELFDDEEPTLHDIFALADDNQVEFLSLEWEDEQGDKDSAQWVRLAAEGKTAGIIYRNGTLNPMAKVNGEAIDGCN